MNTAEGGSTIYTDPDRVLNLYHDQICDVPDSAQIMVLPLPRSWKILGMPDVADLCHTIIVLRRQGAKFSAENILNIGYSLGELFIDPQSQVMAFQEDFNTLVRSIVGLWLPPAIQQELLTLHTKNLKISEKEKTGRYECPICLKNVSEEKKKNLVTLYCGHTFCWKCIHKYGNTPNAAKTCPICRKLLCLEVSSRPNSTLLGEKLWEQQGQWGPSALTNERVNVECTARGISTISNDWDKLRDKLDLHQHTNNRISLDLGLSRGINTDTKMIMPPKKGRVVVPVSMKGVPILAYISSRSPFTIVSPVLAEKFGLVKKNLTSKKFRVFGGTKLTEKNVTALNEFELIIGDFSIKINTAIQVPGPKFIGIQLGLDFVRSLAYW